MIKPVVLLFTDWYYPGFKAGGPIQSCINLVQALQDTVSFFVVSSNLDLGDALPYAAITPNQWVPGRFGEQVWYADRGKISSRQIRLLTKTVQPTAVYFNSMFSVRFTLLPLFLIRRYEGIKLILAPRGMLHPGALGLKAGKKKIFLRIFRGLGLDKEILFQATTKEETGFIREKFPHADVKEVGNIPTFRRQKPATIAKEAGELKLVFLGRIHPTKNLLFLLDIFQKFPFRGRVELEIIGESGNETYANECLRQTAALPPQFQVRYSGALPHAVSLEHLLEGHMLVLPSLGENFGHAIFEALISGKPVLVSDQTPWKDLQAVVAGWDLPLHRPDKFAEVIQQVIDMNQDEYEQWSAAAFRLANNYFKEAAYNSRYLELFS